MTWTDKDGNEWELWQMSDQHLHNVKNMVLRVAEQLDDNACAAFSYPGQGDMATYYADCAGSAAMEQASEFRALAEAIDDEFDRRIAIWEKRKK